MSRSKAQRVHARLTQAAGEWVCSRTLHHPQVGGRRAGARVHELRRQGVVVETLYPCVCEQCRYARLRALRRNEPPTHVAAYRIPVEVSEVAS